MRQYIDVTGKTEDEAISKALEQLGLDRDDVSVEILERAKSGFLGLGSCPAKVRVSYGEEEEPVVIPAAPEKKPEQPKKPAPEKRPERKPKPEKPEKVEKAPKAAPVQDLGEEVDDEKAQAIRKFLTGLLAQMESEAVIKVYQPEKGRYKVILEGQNLGALIGRRGETLDAIQHLTNYAVNRGSEKHLHISVDAENYRSKREESLTRLAEKMAEKAIKYKRSMALEPMNSYERHVIHTALQNYEGVTTSSTGVEPNRRVVVSYVKPEQPNNKPQSREWA